MRVISRHGCFGEALDALFKDTGIDSDVEQVDGQWCLVDTTPEDEQCDHHSSGGMGHCSFCEGSEP